MGCQGKAGTGAAPLPQNSTVTPAQAGVQEPHPYVQCLDSSLRWNDGG